MAFTQTFAVQPLAPFNFDLSAQIFGSAEPTIRSYTNGEFRQALKINGHLVLIKLTSNGTVEKPRITAELKSNTPLTSKDKQEAEKAVRFIFNLGSTYAVSTKTWKTNPSCISLPSNCMG